MQDPYHRKSLKRAIGATFSKIPTQLWQRLTPSISDIRELDTIRAEMTVQLYEEPELRINNMLDKPRYRL